MYMCVMYVFEFVCVFVRVRVCVMLKVLNAEQQMFLWDGDQRGAHVVTT